MIDPQFLRSIQANGFHHRDHLYLTWRVLEQEQVDQAAQRVASVIQHITRLHGQPAKYHETITEFWVRAVAHARYVHPEAGTFDVLLEAEPHLLDKRLPWRHWSEGLLVSDAARSQWIEPDLTPVAFATA